MVASCKNYITDFNTTTLWEQPIDLLIDKLKECCKLYQEYQGCYTKTKQAAETIPAAKPFK